MLEYRIQKRNTPYDKEKYLSYYLYEVILSPQNLVKAKKLGREDYCS